MDAFFRKTKKGVAYFAIKQNIQIKPGVKDKLQILPSIGEGESSPHFGWVQVIGDVGGMSVDPQQSGGVKHQGCCEYPGGGADSEDVGDAEGTPVPATRDKDVVVVGS